MNPYAPPAAPIEPAIAAGGRSLTAEANVRGIGLWNIVGSLLILLGIRQIKGSELFVEVAILVLNVAAGVALLRMQHIGRALELGSDVLGVSRAVYALMFTKTGSVAGLVLGSSLSVWILWYLYFGNGARVLAPEYATLVRDQPEPRPRIATWAKLVTVLLLLLVAVWSFFSDVPRR